MLQRSFHAFGLAALTGALLASLACQPAGAPAPAGDSAAGTGAAAHGGAGAGSGTGAPTAGAAGAAAAGTAAAGSGAHAGAPAAGAADEVVSHTIVTSVETSGTDRYLVATVTPAPGYHCNMEFPRWGVQIADDAPTLAGTRAAREQAVEFNEQLVTFRIPVADAAAAGDIAGTLRMSVCNDEACLMPTEPVRWTLASAQ